MISPDLTIVILVGSLCCAVAFVCYWRGVNATEQRLKPRIQYQQERIEHLLDDLDEATGLLRAFAQQRHPAGRELRLVREDGAS